MKKYLIYLLIAMAAITPGACSPNEDHEPETPGIETPDDGKDDTPENADEPKNLEKPSSDTAVSSTLATVTARVPSRWVILSEQRLERMVQPEMIIVTIPA